MDNSRKKQLKEMYLETLHPMGVLMFENKESGKIYLEEAKNLHAKQNSSYVKLNSGMHVCKGLQADWTKLTEKAFNISVYETLEYDKDEPKRDYTVDLKNLKQLCVEELKAKGHELY